MINAIVLINTARDRINPTAEKLVDIPGVSEVYSVSGQFDLVAILRVASVEQMADIVTNHMLKLGGIQRTETLVAFRTFSQHDLDRLFSIGA
jgi:DNA-binding Lrp family transcriptional regulator